MRKCHLSKHNYRFLGETLSIGLYIIYRIVGMRKCHLSKHNSRFLGDISHTLPSGCSISCKPSLLTPAITD
jgi:hypothetical protein